MVGLCPSRTLSWLKFGVSLDVKAIELGRDSSATREPQACCNGMADDSGAANGKVNEHLSVQRWPVNSSADRCSSAIVYSYQSADFTRGEHGGGVSAPTMAYRP